MSEYVKGISRIFMGIIPDLMFLTTFSHPLLFC